MAKTKDGKKIVHVKEHNRKDGQTTVHTHYRSTPNPPQKMEFEMNKKGNFLSWLVGLFRR